MPIRDRKYYISRHNADVEEQKQKMNMNSKDKKSTNPYLMQQLAENEQSFNKNLRSRW